MKIISLLVALLTLALPAKSDTITIAADTWPPFVDENHSEGGLSIQIIREALGRSGFEVEVIMVPWARALAGVQDGEYDIVYGAWYTDNRAETLAFSEPYINNEIRFIQRVGGNFDFTGLESLRGKTVATIRGYNYGDDFMGVDFFVRDPSNDLIVNIRKLVDERVDLAIEDELVARSTISTGNPALLEQLEFIDPPWSSEGLHVASGLANPRHEEIIEAFNTGLKAMREDGTFDAIIEENNLN